jgi:hypothetical protein
MAGPGHPPSTHERRAHRRFPVLWSATLTAGSTFDPHVLHCRIRNISIAGLHVLVERHLAVGSAVVLHIDRVGTFRGRVVWSEAERLGVAFDDSPEHVAELIKDKV